MKWKTFEKSAYQHGSHIQRLSKNISFSNMHVYMCVHLYAVRLHTDFYKLLFLIFLECSIKSRIIQRAFIAETQERNLSYLPLPSPSGS